MALACVGAIPSDPLGVDIDFVRRHCKAEWASALTSVTVKPLDANGGGLTGATISKLHCSYDPPGAGPATLILKLSDETAMREYKASGQGALGGAGRSGRDRPFSRGALIERHMNWGFGLTEHDMSLNEALFYGQWREQLVSGGCRAPEIYAVCVSIDGLPETEDGAPLPGVALRQMRLQPPRETAPVLLARRRHPNYVPFVLGNQSTGLVTAVIMEDLLADPEATVAFPQFGLTAAIVDPNAPRIEVPEVRLLSVMRAMGRLHAQGWGASASSQPHSPWGNHMVFGLHPIFRRVKKNFGDAKAFKRVLRTMDEWGDGLGVPIYTQPELPQMLTDLHNAFHTWEGGLCQREATTLIHGDLHLGNMVFDAAEEDREPILLDWQFFGSGGPAIDIAYFFLMSLAPDPLLEERLIRCYIDALHAAGVPASELDFDTLQDRVDALMIEVVVHFTTVRVFSAAMKDPTYSLPTMQTKLASDNPSQVDAATAFIAVDANALGRVLKLWQGYQEGVKSSGAKKPRAARFFAPEAGGSKL